MTSEEAGLRQEKATHYEDDAPESFVPLAAEIDDNHQERKRPYLPSCYSLYDKIKGSIYLAFLSHLCFILASLFYLKLALVTLQWYLYTKRMGVPEDVVNEDTDEAWNSWTSENGADNILDDWEAYSLKYELLYILGAIFFVFVGLFDLIRYFDCLNIALVSRSKYCSFSRFAQTLTILFPQVLAGVAGMISALSKTYQETTIWDFVSVHMFLMEAINLLHRNHDYEGVACFRIGDVCFLVGAVLDCVGSYVGIAGHEGLWVLHMDVFSCCLWLLSGLTDITAEIYYLRKHVGNDGIGAVHCY